MTTTRQDAWTHDEDLLLAEVVLRHIREGATQLAAFEEVGRKLSRTAAACGFRWNSHVRKQYKTGIEVAKKQRKELRTYTSDMEQSSVEQDQNNEEKEVIEVSNEKFVNQNQSQSSNTIKELITFLKQYEEAPAVNEIQAENQRLTTENIELKEIIKKLKQEKTTLSNNLQVIEADYHALIEVMDKVRKMVILQEDERNRKVKFQMDKNGVLERVEK
ncbi:RsfA family transcriptional regulator [Metabacillus litoralis]|uniref:RsfA family transcriptional regulator n=1 Tax=Metabacillus litoralis TaxID=152268 RepID=A0A5C6W2E7_9BACI|nr:RsfA family transcriptional regulator [Metabacillus litoralis]TXC92064.1 RsfA family transcriptional regulator [Metabacillus litoralis]